MHQGIVDGALVIVIIVAITVIRRKCEDVELGDFTVPEGIT